MSKAPEDRIEALRRVIRMHETRAAGDLKKLFQLRAEIRGMKQALALVEAARAAKK